MQPSGFGANKITCDFYESLLFLADSFAKRQPVSSLLLSLLQVFEKIIITVPNHKCYKLQNGTLQRKKNYSSSKHLLKF